jgi:hypothetical protein
MHLTTSSREPDPKSLPGTRWFERCECNVSYPAVWAGLMMEDDEDSAEAWDGHHSMST